jgi:hypothetical protein
VSVARPQSAATVQIEIDEGRIDRSGLYANAVDRHGESDWRHFTEPLEDRS